MGVWFAENIAATLCPASNLVVEKLDLAFALEILGEHAQLLLAALLGRLHGRHGCRTQNARGWGRVGSGHGGLRARRSAIAGCAQRGFI